MPVSGGAGKAKLDVPALCGLPAADLRKATEILIEAGDQRNLQSLHVGHTQRINEIDRGRGVDPQLQGAEDRSFVLLDDVRKRGQVYERLSLLLDESVDVEAMEAPYTQV